MRAGALGGAGRGAAPEGRGGPPPEGRGVPAPPRPGGAPAALRPGGGRGPAGPAGSGIPGDSFTRTAGVAWDRAGNIYVADGAGRRHRQRARGQVRQGRRTSSSRGAARNRAGTVQLAARHRDRRQGAASTWPTRGNKRIQVFDGDGNPKASDRRRSARPPAICITPGAASDTCTSRTRTTPRRSTTARSTSWSSTARSSASSAAPAGCRRSSASSTRSIAAARTSCWSASCGNWRVQKLTLKPGK